MTQDILQSEGWERFEQALGRKTERIAGVLVIEMPLPFRLRYWYAPRSEELRITNNELWDRMCSIAEKNGAVFLRSEADVDRSIIHDSCFMIPRILRHEVEPEWTWRTSLNGTDDELLARMHEKHRYNIRLAQKHGVSVRVMSNIQCPISNADMEACWYLLQETARRQGIATYLKTYYETMLRALPNAMLYLAEHDGIPIATAIVAYYDDTATYLHGGSSYERRNLMAPHLLHWQAMRDAKAAGTRWYDFGGVAPESSKLQAPSSKPEWEGLSRFKKGFGGEAVHHPPMRDLVFRPRWYTMLSWLAQLRK